MPLHSSVDFQTTWTQLRAPPLQFRRRPPQSNYPPTSVPLPDKGSRLESQNHQGGISPLAPPNPKVRYQSLPPILRRWTHNSLIGYSKGARGLSVLWRASGVFTGTTNSPGKLLRQSSDRYAIRAGRNDLGTVSTRDSVKL